jgi:hypothetical protein
MPLQFEPITLDKQVAYQDILAQCPQKTSDYSFVNLWGWAREYDLSWAWDDRLVWIRQNEPESIYWAPVGPWAEVDWNARFSTHVSESLQFNRIPSQLMECWKSEIPDRIQIQESRGHWDYLYDCTELVELKGNRFHKKKNLVNQFLRKYEFTYDSLTADRIDLALTLQTDWCTWRDCESFDTLAAENRSIQRVLENWTELEGLLGGLLLVEGEIAAYTVAERLSEDMVVIHFEKANPEFKGAYQAINQMFLAHLDKGFSLANREQDLDDEGLRKAKLSYHPIDFLKKYQITILD